MSLGAICIRCSNFKITQKYSILSTTLKHYSTEKNIPVINFPTATKNRILRRTGLKKKKTKVFGLAQPGKVYISSSDRKESIFTHDVYNKFNPPKISMETWTSRKSPGRFLKIHSIQENPSKKTVSSFSKLLESSPLVKALAEIKITKPTVVQEKVIPVVNGGKNVLFAAETGSGKTWTYLLPILKRIMESSLKNDGPTAIVLVPTKELCAQVASMGRKLQIDGINFWALTSTIRSPSHWSFDSELPDVVVATPASLKSAIYKNSMNFTSVKYLVVDECDTMLDETFADQTLRIIQRFNIVDGTKQPLGGERMTTQLLMCSATFPSYAEDILNKVLDTDTLEKIRTGYLHRLPTHVTHTFLRVKPSEKLNKVVEKIEDSHLTKQTIVFCNKTSTCFAVARACTAAGVSVSSCHGKMDNKERKNSLNNFLNQKTNVMISTDLLSRGLNTPKVDQVINFDVPSQLSDYLHRSGRVGRVDSSNRNADVITYASRKYETEILKEIENAARKRTELKDVDANIKKRHRIRWQQLEEDAIEVSTL